MQTNGQRQAAVRGVLSAAAQDAVSFDWSACHPVAALYCLPAIVFVIAVGFTFGQPLAALIASGGALSVGFGSFQHLTRVWATPMLLAAVGMSVSAFVGTLVSGVPGLEAATAGLWGFALGLFVSLGTASWWVLLQSAIALVIAATYPADLPYATLRAGLTLAGGAVQIVTIYSLWLIAPGPFKGLAPPNETLPPRTLREARITLRRAAALSSARLRYCTGLGLSVAAGVVVFRALGLPNGYWVPMTVLLVLRWGGLRQTLGRGIARCAGTMLGAGLSTALAAFIQPSPATLLTIAMLAVWICYAIQFVNYGAFSLALTTYIVLLFAVTGLPEPVTALHRALATLVGGAVALAGQLLVRAFHGTDD
ncbi:MAG: FUSC family protein [Pseudomonadota bacterium]|nr:FUSC family protein [Pseudomonadota bacterium]